MEINPAKASRELRSMASQIQNPLEASDRNTLLGSAQAIDLLDLIVKPGDHEISRAIEQAQELLGYKRPGEAAKKKRGRPMKRIGGFSK